MSDNNAYGENDNRRLTLYFALMAVISVFLSHSGFSIFIFFIPMLTISVSIKSARNAFLYFLGAGIVVLGWKLFDLRSVIGKPENLGIVFVSLVYTVMVIAGVLVWVSLKNYSNNVMRKLIFSSLACMIIGAGFVVWYNVFATQNQIARIIETYRQIFVVFRGEEGATGLAEVVFTLVMLTVVPFGIIFSSFQILVSEFIIHKRDEKWQRNFSLIKMPDRYLFVFVGLWVLTGVSAFVQAVPAFVKAVLLNVALGFCLHYILTGISILFFFMRQRNPKFTAGKMFSIVIIAMLIPLVNAFVFVMLILLSVSEIWLKFRRKNITGTV